jgi:site-specific DNA-methyltransferase (adenine-specific)
MRDVLPLLTERAALILTDPPYRLTSGGNSTGEMGGCFAKDRYDNSGELFPIVEWADLAPLLFAAAREDADAIVMANDKNLNAAESALARAGFKHHRTLVWDKRTVTAGKYFMQGLEFGLYMWRGHARTISDPSTHPLFRVPHRDETLHPTEKPVAMLQRWIELTTDPGDLVIDPFMGSGSTAIAALRAGRRFIGIEVMPRWYDVAARRVAAHVANGQGQLFEGAAS